jgi:hypothetical protein
MPEQTQDDVVQGAATPPRPPLPDLGFFAGPPAPAGGSAGFGGSSSSGAPPLPPPAGPVPAAAPSGWTPARVLRRVGIPIVGLVVLGVFGVGVFGGLAGFLAGDLELPSTLQGMAPSTDPTAGQVARQLETELEQRNSGDAIAGVYGATPAILFVAGQRTRVSVEREMADARVTTTTEMGDSTCGVNADGLSLCLRTGGSTTIIVFGSLPIAQVAAAVDEVWDAQ